MKLIIAVMAVLLPALSAPAQQPVQNKKIEPYVIGERMPDLPLQNIINFNHSNASLSSLGDKLIILDFWNIHCTSCIYMFPMEDSLQEIFSKDVQFVLVTSDTKERVETFLSKYNAGRKKPLGLPVITGDHIFNRLFRFLYIPHYVWVAPNGLILAESSDWFITKENIANTLLPIRAEEKRLQGNRYADFNLYMQKPTKELLQSLSSTNN